MFMPFGSPRKNCDGVTRRQALRIGASGLLGGLSMPWLLEMQANQALKLPFRAAEQQPPSLKLRLAASRPLPLLEHKGEPSEKI